MLSRTTSSGLRWCATVRASPTPAPADIRLPAIDIHCIQLRVVSSHIMRCMSAMPPRPAVAQVFVLSSVSEASSSATVASALAAARVSRSAPSVMFWAEATAASAARIPKSVHSMNGLKRLVASGSFVIDVLRVQ